MIVIQWNMDYWILIAPLINPWRASDKLGRALNFDGKSLFNHQVRFIERMKGKSNRELIRECLSIWFKTVLLIKG